MGVDGDDCGGSKMKMIKISEATEIQLDYLVAKCQGEEYQSGKSFDGIGNEHPPHRYSSDWAQGGPIIEREKLTIDWAYRMEWEARIYIPDEEPWVMTGPTSLIAAMRCYVASKLGDEAEVPEEQA